MQNAFRLALAVALIPGSRPIERGAAEVDQIDAPKDVPSLELK